MKTLAVYTLGLATLVAASLQAGPATEYKQVAPPPPVYWGTGFYGGIDMGANVYQNRGGDRTFTNNNVNSDFFDWSLDVSPKNDVGFFGGIKLGYVFGTGIVRPTLEGDFFYNGFRGGADFTLKDNFDNVVAQRNVTSWINTGAFMGNFILRLAPEGGRFQPYAGAGVGIYFAESAGVEVQDPVTGITPINTGGGANHADLAWQVVAGSDYFFTPQLSAFIEYHYLDYTSTQIDTNQSRDLGQHLIGAGIRYFFH
ncbi:MAG TPA: outer membrane beta-barrel protein [Candidatus Udaeobacter sp.]|nr:outer membrane beta-barrel protein [Candidatus Udaeobacter sp.]